MTTYNGGMTLGELIKALEKCEPKKPVYLDLLNLRPTTVDSYRGFYECLSLGYRADGPVPTVAEVLAMLCEAVSKTYEGYKGGTYRMDDETEVYIGNRGETTNRVIAGIQQESYCVFITTSEY